MQKQKALRPINGDERPAFRGTTRIRADASILTRTQPSRNGGGAVPLSRAAPGRTKGHRLRQAFSRRPALSLEWLIPYFPDLRILI